MQMAGNIFTFEERDMGRPFMEKTRPTRSGPFDGGSA
jgi:hypothetical protein